MKTTTQRNGARDLRQWAIALLVLVAGALFALGSVPAHAAAPAGSVIGNQATATYTDAGGTSRSATSNLVQTTVQQVKSFTLNTNNQTRTAAPGQTVYYPHYITNTGNGTDTYTLTGPASSSFAGSPGGPHTSLAYYIDADGNGLPDNATAITTTGPLASGGIFRFVAAGTVPGSASDTSTATITVTASDTSGNPAVTNTDTTTVANSVITVTKALSVTSGPSPSTANITVTLSYTNSGTAAATNVNIVDTLPSGMTYVAGSGRWSVSGTTALTDATEGSPEQGGSTGIRYSVAANVVTANINTVNAGVSGTVTFEVSIDSGLSPRVINNFASYTTATQTTSANTNTASYTVAQTAAVAFNGSATTAGAADSDPLTVASANAGSTITYNNYVWNRGNSTDTFDITIVGTPSFPGGVASVALYQQDGATTLINSSGTSAPDTGPIPGRNSAACVAPFVQSADGYCGYKVVVKVVLPSSATGGPYSAVLRASSVFDTTVADNMTDALTAVTANTVDLTNDLSIAGGAAAADGLGSGATNTGVKRTNTVAPLVGSTTTTTFTLVVNNTSGVTDTFNLTASGTPAGWAVSFRANTGGSCATPGAVITSTNPLAASASQLLCAVITIPAAASGQAAPGNRDFTFTATSQTNAAVTDSIVDRVTLSTVRSVTLTPNNTQQTFPGGAVTYNHTINNAGNVDETAATLTFAAGCLADSRSGQGWSSTAYIDSNGNGTLDVGTDTLITCGSTGLALAVGQSRTIFVRVFAPGSAVSSDPANVTTLTASYNSTTASATDTTSVTDGLMMLKEQQAILPANCGNNNPPAGSYTSAAIPASASTVPGACIAYRITVTNTTAAPITNVVISDIVPPNTKVKHSCSGNGVSQPNVTLGSVTQMVGDGATGTLRATIPTLNSTQSATLYFCVQID